MLRTLALFASLFSFHLTLNAENGPIIDMPANLPTPFGIALGKPFQPGPNDTLISNAGAFDVYLVKPPNPIGEVFNYIIYVSKRYQLISGINCGLKTAQQANTVKAKLSKAYGGPRLPSAEEYAEIMRALGEGYHSYYSIKHYWRKAGWSILIAGGQSRNRLFFNVDHLTRRSIEYAPKNR